jgi:hypothetical protein
MSLAKRLDIAVPPGRQRIFILRNYDSVDSLSQLQIFTASALRKTEPTPVTCNDGARWDRNKAKQVSSNAA